MGDNTSATAVGAIAFLDRWWTAWRTGLQAAGEERLWQPCNGVEGDYPEMQLGVDDPFIGMVLHQHRELMHHGAEVNLLRDLYRAGQPRDEFVYAILHVDEAAIRAHTDSDPSTLDRYRRERPDLPLRAAETGRVDAVRLVADLGFDVNTTAGGVTALQHAIAGGYLDLVEALIDAGAGQHVRQHAAQAVEVARLEHCRHGRLRSEHLGDDQLSRPAAAFGERELHPAAVLGVGGAVHIAALDQGVDQLGDGLFRDAHSLYKPAGVIRVLSEGGERPEPGLGHVGVAGVGESLGR